MKVSFEGIGEQLLSFIPESDLYRLIFRSKLPSAERFTDWMTREGLDWLGEKLQIHDHRD